MSVSFDGLMSVRVSICPPVTALADCQDCLFVGMKSDCTQIKDSAILAYVHPVFSTHFTVTSFPSMCSETHI